MEEKVTMFMDNKNRSFSMIADLEGDMSDLSKEEIPDCIPILAVRNIVLFPGVITPILIGRDSSYMTWVYMQRSSNCLHYQMEI